MRCILQACKPDSYGVLWSNDFGVRRWRSAAEELAAIQYEEEEFVGLNKRHCGVVRSQTTHFARISVS